MVYWLSLVNPFTHAVELIRFAMYGQLNLTSLGVVAGCAAVAFFLAARGYDPQAGAIRKVKRD
jgi:ABC-2 type transport system permease protein